MSAIKVLVEDKIRVINNGIGWKREDLKSLTSRIDSVKADIAADEASKAELEEFLKDHFGDGQ